MSFWDAPSRFPPPGSLYPCCRPPKPPSPPCPPPSPPPCAPECPNPCSEEFTVRVMGSDNCGNLILCVKRPRYCWCNGEWVSCKRWR